MTYTNNEFCIACGKPMPAHEVVLKEMLEKEQKAKDLARLESDKKDPANALYWQQLRASDAAECDGPISSGLAMELRDMWVAIRELQENVKKEKRV